MRRLLLAPLLLSILAAAQSAPAAAPPPRPNILVVMVDDMGWSDPGCYGGEIRTPHLDALAAGGLRFSAFYNCGRCCPTRAALLTGLYPHQAGVGAMTFDTGHEGYRGRLHRHTPTIPELLRAAGYRTAMVGKWHLSLTRQGEGHMAALNNQRILEQFSDPATYPVARGFERHYGVVWGVVNFFDPFSLVENTQAVREVPAEYYVTDAFTDRAVQWINEYAESPEPFFLYLAHCAPHWPLHALPEDIERYAETYQPGWERVREGRYRRQRELGLFNPETTPLPERTRPRRLWEENADRAWDARAMAVHAAMIDRVDQGLGRIVEALKRNGQLENTLLLFLSDNGASPEEPGAPGFDRVSQTRDGRPVTYYGGGKPKKTLPGGETTYAGIGPDWANVANTPFRFHKATQHEGGIRTPLVVHWPAGLRAAAGSVTHEPGHVIDLLSTCLDLAGGEFPAEWGGRATEPSPGRSLVPLLRGEEPAGERTLYFEHLGARAIRTREWKLVSRDKGPWELHDLRRDQSETTDLAAAHPDRVSQMAAEWRAWAERSHVLKPE